MARDKQEFEENIALQYDRVTLDIEERQQELQIKKNEKKQMFAEIEKKMRAEYGAAPTELIQSHRNLLLDIDKLMVEERAKMVRSYHFTL